MPAHDHPLRSGVRDRAARRWPGVQQAAVEHAPEDVLPLPAAIEPVAVLGEVGLTVPRAHAVEDVERPTLEVGEHDVRPGQPGVDVGARRGVARLSAGGDRGASRGREARSAGVLDDAQERAYSARSRTPIPRPGCVILTAWTWIP